METGRLGVSPLRVMETTELDNPATAPLPWDTVDPLIEVAPAPEPSPARSETRNPTPEPRTHGGAFTIPLICMGIGLIALCLLIPAADENRRLAYEHVRLQQDLDQLHKQVETNDAFLQRLSGDPTLAERLARRQMKMVPAGTAVLELKSQKHTSDMSPFLLVTVPPPAPMLPYRPIGGFIANAVRQPKSQLYLIGAGMMLIAIGVVVGRSAPASEADALDEQDVSPHNSLPNVS